MRIVHPLLKSAFEKRAKQLDYTITHAIDIQQRVFKNLVHKARHTEWGKTFDYRSINTLSSFQSRVPVSTYEQLFPFIHRVMKGEKNILWPSAVRWFAKSSGTTNDRSKFIPITPESLHECHFAGGKDLIALYMRQAPAQRLLDGKALTLGGSLELNTWNPSGKSFFGDVSAVITKNLPFWVQWFRTPSLPLALMNQWEEKINQMAYEASQEDVRSIAGVPTWTLVLLKRLLEITGKKTISDIWPNLELYMHGAVSFAPYKNTFRALIGKPINYIETYNASEGFFAIQDILGLEELLLMPDYGIFYEFIPVDELSKDTPKAYGLHDVEVGRNYALVISTNSGLWRYLIGDTIRFTSTHPFRIKITGRTKQFINAFGEELMVENVELAIAKSCQLTEAVISDFTVAPIYMNDIQKGGHEWVIEFMKSPSDLSLFVDTLDNTLKSLNSDYEAKRSYAMALQEPLIQVVPEGTFYQWMKKRGKLGAQHKVPRLCNSREYVDDILSFKSRFLS